MLAAHYAPSAGVRLTNSADAADVATALLASGVRVGLLAPNEITVPDGVARLEAPAIYDGDSVAPILYARLREADTLGLDVFVVVVPDERGLGWAVADRLRRAAHGTTAS